MTARCPDCPTQDFLPIIGSGPIPCPILGLGERPGRREMERNAVFCGPTGEELDQTYLPLANLYRSEIRIENICRCYALGNRAPTNKEIFSCARFFLPNVLKRVQPELIILMGGSAHRIVDQIGDRKVRVDMMHGRPFQASLLDGLWTGWIWSSYHPSLGMHDTSKMSDLMDDFRNLAGWRSGEWTPPEPGEVKKDYALIETASALRSYLQAGTNFQRDQGHGFGIPGVIRSATDTERHGSAMWSTQVSLRPHSARLLRYLPGDSVSRSIFDEFLRWQQETRAEIVLHNAPQDLDAMGKMGVEPDEDLFSDTMQEAFQQARPQGLKTLAYRFKGVSMQSWQEVVWPASVEAAVEWLDRAIGLAEEHLRTDVVTEMKTWTCKACGHKAHPEKKCKSKAGGAAVPCGCEDWERFSNLVRSTKPGAMEAVLRHVLAHTGRSSEDDKPYNPWKAIKKTVFERGGLRGNVPEPYEWEGLEAVLGPMPILGIGNCTITEAVAYGCSDADHTGQVAEELALGRASEADLVPEEDWDR